MACRGSVGAPTHTVHPIAIRDLCQVVSDIWLNPHSPRGLFKIRLEVAEGHYPLQHLYELQDMVEVQSRKNLDPHMQVFHKVYPTMDAYIHSRLNFKKSLQSKVRQKFLDRFFLLCERGKRCKSRWGSSKEKVATLLCDCPLIVEDQPQCCCLHCGSLHRFPDDKGVLLCVEEYWNSIREHSSHNSTFDTQTLPDEHAILYGTDLELKLDIASNFSLSRINSLLRLTPEDLSGLTTSHSYFGTKRSTFVWHHEDMDLLSANYLHFGSPKVWLFTEENFADVLDRKMTQLRKFSIVDTHCRNMLRHKNLHVNPDNLQEGTNLPYRIVVQYPGDMVIVPPHIPHMGFNLGYNFAEATNFATPEWIPYGKRASICSCLRTMVNLDMGPFISMYQKDSAERWADGSDVDLHPSDTLLQQESPLVYIPVSSTYIGHTMVNVDIGPSISMDLKGSAETLGDRSEVPLHPCDTRLHQQSPLMEVLQSSCNIVDIQTTSPASPVEACQGDFITPSHSIVTSTIKSKVKRNCPHCEKVLVGGSHAVRRHIRRAHPALATELQKALCDQNNLLRKTPTQKCPVCDTELALGSWHLSRHMTKLHGMSTNK